MHILFLTFCLKTQAIDHILPLLEGERSCVLYPKAARWWWVTLATLIDTKHKHITEHLAWAGKCTSSGHLLGHKAGSSVPLGSS